jgi:hypothetical protein
MTPNAQKALLGISAVILIVSGLSLFTEYSRANARTNELLALSNDVKLIGEEMTKLRAQVEAYEKAKAPTETAAAPAATPAPAPAK